MGMLKRIEWHVLAFGGYKALNNVSLDQCDTKGMKYGEDKQIQVCP